MQALLETIHDYQRLLAYDDFGIPLDERQAARLGELAADLGLNPSRQIERREMPRSTKPFPISFLRADGFCFGLVADISGVGMKVRTPRPAEVGAEVLVHFPEIESGLEYVFPARVVWAQERSMGLRFSGVPIRHDVSA